MFMPRKNGVAKIMMNTILAGSSAGFVATIVKPHVMGTYSRSNRYDVGALCNGILAGLVSITASCNNVTPWMAFVIGVIGGVVYSYGCKLLDVVNVDDPVEAAAVHGFCGMWGLIATGFFDQDQGLFSGNREKMGAFFGNQWLGLLCICTWTILTCGLYFFGMKKLGLLRVSLFDEIIGLDITEMGSYDPMVVEVFKQYNERKVSDANELELV